MKKQHTAKKTPSRGEALSAFMERHGKEREQINRTFLRLEGEIKEFAKTVVGKYFKSVIVDGFYDPCTARFQWISIELSVRKDGNGTERPLSMKGRKYVTKLIKVLRLEKGFKFRRRNNGRPVSYYPDAELRFP